MAGPHLRALTLLSDGGGTPSPSAPVVEGRGASEGPGRAF